jgi:hypothetical protein
VKTESAKKRFLQLVKEFGKPLKSLAPSEGVDLMLLFYQKDRVDGCPVDEHGDMLLYQWGTYDWGQGESFEFDITRQFIEGEPEDDNITQLSLTFRFKPTESMRNIIEGNLWCSSPKEMKSFRSFILGSPAYLAVRHELKGKVSLEFGIAG